MDEQIENSVPEEIEVTGEEHDSENKAMLLFPLLISIFLFAGFSQDGSFKKDAGKFSNQEAAEEDGAPKLSLSALLATEEFSKSIRDTVYTDRDLWLELRIDQQMLYVHYRDGRIVKYPVSTGNPYASKSVESRPGLFAIFLKNEVHLSSQFNNARMNYFMPYNMGIGFHGLPGTGYYGHLGVRPSSHGCIRMKNEDVRVIFQQSDIGTLVLSHRGKSTRTIAFAPKDFRNDAEYTKEDYLNMLAYNLSSVMEGKYFTHPPKRFILDGTVIPRSGVNVLSTDDIPEKQLLPFAVARIEMKTDVLAVRKPEGEVVREANETLFTAETGGDLKDTVKTSSVSLPVNPELVKKYVYNPVGILPYFPPDR